MKFRHTLEVGYLDKSYVLLRTLTYSLKVMKLRQIIVMVQAFGHFDRINFLKLFPEVNLRDISKNI